MVKDTGLFLRANSANTEGPCGRQKATTTWVTDSHPSALAARLCLDHTDTG